MNPDDAPSAAELIEIPPDRVTLAWCVRCAVITTFSAGRTCLRCGGDLSAVTYEWVDDE